MSIDLDACRELVAGLSNFDSCETSVSAAEAMQSASAPPRSSWVSTATERAGKNEGTTGYHRQRVTQTVSILFVMAAERADGAQSDELEDAKNAVVDALVGWTPPGALNAFLYVSYALVLNADGLLWGEVLVQAPYMITRR
jgi:hypothetical protein